MDQTVLPFPERNKGRKRKSQSLDAAGCLSLSRLERDGDRAPDNVQRIDEPNGAELPSTSVELLFSTLIWQVLTPDQQERILTPLRHWAYDKDRKDCALPLYNLLTGKR